MPMIFYEKNDAPKQVWVRELVKKARVKLRAVQLPPAWPGWKRPYARCNGKVAKIKSLMELVRRMWPSFRRAEALGYPVAGV